MRNLLKFSVATCFVLSPALGFHTPVVPSRPIVAAAMTTTTTTTAKSSTSLYYKNKTETFFEVPTAASVENNADMIYTSWGSYKDTGESVAVLEQPVLELDDLEEKEYTNSGDEDEWSTEYYEDGTPFDSTEPSLEVLKSWTQEYIDSVDLAGGMTRVSVGVQHMLSSEFVFTSPTIGPLNKPDYVKLMDYYRLCGFDLASAIPDLKVSYDGWHLDPHDPSRIWVIARYSGTHVGTATVPGTDLKLTPPNKGDHPVTFTTGPEMQSFLWTADKQLLWHTAGFVGDEYTGSNQGYGGLDGLLVSMGLPHLYLDTMSPMRRFKSWFSQFQSDNGETMARTKTRFGRLPQWWNERKLYDLNIHK